MGSIISKSIQFPNKEYGREHFYENEDSEAYCSSVLQVLYHYAPLRMAIISWGNWRKRISQSKDNDQFLDAAEDRLKEAYFEIFDSNKESNKIGQTRLNAFVLSQYYMDKKAVPESNVTKPEHYIKLRYDQVECLLVALFELFNGALQKKRPGITKPTQIVRILKKKGELFYSYAGNTASQFLAFLLNYISFMMRITNKEVPTVFSNCSAAGEDPVPDNPFTIIENTFKGELVYETLCCTCETQKNITGNFLHLLIDIRKPYTSLNYCLNHFLKPYYVRGVFCDQCQGFQEIKVCTKFNCLPKVMILNLRRRKSKKKTQGDFGISQQFAYSYEIRIPPSETLYALYAVVAHYSPCISGHYVGYVRSKEGWVIFDELGIHLTTIRASGFSFIDAYESINQRIKKTGVLEEILFYEKSQIDSLTLEIS